MPLFTCQAVLFDLDGVLVDSTPCVTRVWTTWANEHGLDPDHVVHVAHGQRAIETVRKVAPQLDAEREFRNIEQMELEDTEGLRVLPGARELLEALPTERFTIVTSGTRRLATKRLKTVGLPVPANMVTADEVMHVASPIPSLTLQAQLPSALAAVIAWCLRTRPRELPLPSLPAHRSLEFRPRTRWKNSRAPLPSFHHCRRSSSAESTRAVSFSSTLTSARDDFANARLQLSVRTVWGSTHDWSQTSSSGFNASKLMHRLVPPEPARALVGTPRR